MVSEIGQKNADFLPNSLTIRFCAAIFAFFTIENMSYYEEIKQISEYIGSLVMKGRGARYE
jgi:hypothetical protein